MKRKSPLPDESNRKRAKLQQEESKFLESDSESDASDGFGGFVPANALEEEHDFGESDDEELKRLEAESRALEEQQAKIEEEGMLELRETIEEKLKQSAADLETASAPNIGLLKDRIESVLDLLRDFRNLRQPGRSRSDYIEQLQKDLCTFYGYNDELMQLFTDLFSPDELHAFLEANDQERPVTIRTNTLKVRRKEVSKALGDRGVSLDPVGDWTTVGLKIYASKVPIGATPEYLAGHYMLQSASSFLPVMALDPQPGEKVLDMAAAPGGKTSHIAQRMKNSGLLVANDVSKPRLAALKSNLHRLGVANALIVNFDGKKLPEHLNGFNRILLDAPCTGLGVISRDESIKQRRTLQDVWKLSKLQKELILAAIDMLEVKSQTATLVYSTCSVSVEENEDVVAYALKKRFVKLVDSGLKFGTNGFTRYKEKRFPPVMNLTKRFYPHTHNMDGFFVAKFVKFRGGERAAENEEEEDDSEEDSVKEEKPKEKKVEKKTSNRTNGEKKKSKKVKKKKSPKS